MNKEYLKEFEKLNEYQKQAVLSSDRYVLLNAVVGSGKTTVLIHKILYLNIICNVPLENIIVLTFTNKAAKDILDRLSKYDNTIYDKAKYFGTFHSVANTILNESKKLNTIGYNKGFDIIDNTKAYEMLNSILENNNLKIKYKSRLLKRIEDFKKGKKLFGIMKKDDDIEKLYKIYKEEKIKNNVMDFDDIIENCIKVIDEPLNPYYIIIDEFQDTDINQLELIRKISGKDTHIFAIGDENQIIYSFRTGTNKIFDKYRELYNPKEYYLPINYRSTKNIVEAAKAFISKGKIDSALDYGNPIIIKKHYDSFNEALYIARKIKDMRKSGIEYNDIAVLYRQTAQAEVLTEVFKKEDIPYKVVFKGENIFECKDDEKDKNLYVNLMTLHSSKGLEFLYVFIIGANMGNIPISSKRDIEEEEARLFFVGLTRAKKYLEISYVSKPNLAGALPYESPYISMIPKEVVIKEDLTKENTLLELYDAVRKERITKKDETKKVFHDKYGEGIVVYEDENIIKVLFEGYGEKEFSKLFCTLKFI